MVDVRCYKVTNGVFNGDIYERWVQVFINENYEDEYDEDSDLYFFDINTEIGGIPLFGTSEDFMDIEELQKELEIAIKKYVPQLILLTEYELFKQIIEASTYEQISSVEVVPTTKRTMIHYAIINYDLPNQVLLVAV